MNMMKMVMVLLFLVGASTASNPFVNPPWNPAAQTQCYRCSEFNSQGIGFVEYPDHTQCCKYYECWKDDGATALQGAEMICPDGTWFNPSVGGNGAPCTASKPYPECLDSCGVEPLPPWRPLCQLWPNPANPQEFGMMDGAGVFHLQDTCRMNFVFDHDSCTCIGAHTPCFCMMDLPLIDDIKDYSCTRGHTFPSGNSITYVLDPDLGPVSHFDKAIVTDPVFSGLYANCWINNLSVGILLKANDPSSATMQGVVCYSSCSDIGPAQPSFCISVGQNKVVAQVGTHTVEWGPIMGNEWYYAAFVYKRKAKKNNLKLYVYDFVEFVTCYNGGPCPYKDVTDTGNACIEPRACGLSVGFTGSSANTNEYFDGYLSRAQVYHGLNIFGCTTPIRKP